MAAKSYWNGIIVGIVAALAIAYISTTLSWLGWLNTMLTSIGTWFIAQTWWPTTIEFLQSVATVKYIFAGVIGFIIGIWVEAK